MKKISIKIHGELDTQQIGNMEIDYGEHCGSSSARKFGLWTIDSTCIASGWEEWEELLWAEVRFLLKKL